MRLREKERETPAYTLIYYTRKIRGIASVSTIYPLHSSRAVYRRLPVIVRAIPDVPPHVPRRVDGVRSIIGAPPRTNKRMDARTGPLFIFNRGDNRKGEGKWVAKGEARKSVRCP